MSNTQNLRRRAWCVLRPVVGWGFIILGLLGMVLPVLQGVLFLAIGISLVGKRSYPIRLARVHIKLLLRWWEGLPSPLLSAPGRWLRRAQQEVSRRQRHVLRRLRQNCQPEESNQPDQTEQLTREQQGPHARTPRG
jgi:hypothetical protein